MEPLILIAYEKWPKVLQILRSSWPHSVAGYCFLNWQYSKPELTKAFNFRVYCPNGIIEDGLVMTSNFTDDSYSLFIQVVNKKTEALEKALLNTKLIEWKNKPKISAASQEVVFLMKKIEKSINLCLIEAPCLAHIRSKDSDVYENLICPPQTYISLLKPEHLDIVDKSWTFYNKDSYEFFNILNLHNLIYALYSEVDHKPLAWMSIDEAGAFCHLFCVEEHRKKGLANFIVKYVCNELLRSGNNALLYTIKGNSNAQNLFKKLDFETVGVVSWLIDKTIYIEK